MHYSSPVHAPPQLGRPTSSKRKAKGWVYLSDEEDDDGGYERARPGGTSSGPDGREIERRKARLDQIKRVCETKVHKPLCNAKLNEGSGITVEWFKVPVEQVLNTAHPERGDVYCRVIETPMDLGKAWEQFMTCTDISGVRQYRHNLGLVFVNAKAFHFDDKVFRSADLCEALMVQLWEKAKLEQQVAEEEQKQAQAEGGGGPARGGAGAGAAGGYSYQQHLLAQQQQREQQQAHQRGARPASPGRPPAPVPELEALARSLRQLPRDRHREVYMAIAGGSPEALEGVDEATWECDMGFIDPATVQALRALVAAQQYGGERGGGFGMAARVQAGGGSGGAGRDGASGDYFFGGGGGGW